MTQNDRILAVLERHPDGITHGDLYRALHPPVENIRARISDLRKRGHLIESRSDGPGPALLILRVPEGQLALALDKG